MAPRTLFFLGGASLLSGLEARAHYRVASADAFLIATPRLARYGISSARWAASCTVESKPRGVSPVRNAVEVLRAVAPFVSRHGPFQRVVLGDLTRSMRITAALNPGSDIVVVDDGLGALIVAEQRREPPARFIDRVLDPRRLTFFSAFGIRGRAADEVVQNSYVHLRETARRGKRPYGWIVGQPLVEHGIVDELPYARLLEKLVGTIRGVPRYVLHPNEDERVATARARAIGIETVRYDGPLELEALRGAPQSVVGFCSSALGQLALLFGREIPMTSMRLPALCVKRNHAGVATAYAELTRIAGLGTALSVIDEPPTATSATLREMTDG